MSQLCALFRTLVVLTCFFGATHVIASNQLAGHPSPYLAMHAEDPVDWRTWQETVFDDARADNRLVFVSIGYFSCHWCHVMHRQSYQDAGIAKLLNQRYIPVKVDRELDPDLDRRLIDFVEAIRGSAGWPLNVFLTPDGYPVTGFTYLPRDNFAAVLEQLDTQWRQDQAGITEVARDFFLTQMQGYENQQVLAPNLTPETLADAFMSQVMQAADELQGGFGNTSKFPNVPQLNSLLDLIRHNRNFEPDVVDFVKLTLQVMVSRNLYDHVNGGFFRYTTDPDWQTPHFEKMLYDNAQLAALYLKADRQWPDQGFADTAIHTLEFVEENLKHPAGAYMSSLSAVDDNDKEGGAYFWSREQLAEVLNKAELEYLVKHWNLDSKPGEFLISPLPINDSGLEAETNKAILRKLQTRGSSSMPVDDKRLASWNAMMLDALTAASDIDARFAKRAGELFDRLKTDFYRDGSLIRFADNPDVADAVFEDYAQLALAFLNFGRRFDRDDAIDLAKSLTETAHSLFLKQDRWQQKAQPLIPIAQGKWVIPDLVFFSPMTLWLEVALEVPGLDPEVQAIASSMLQRATREMLSSPYFYGSFIMLRVEHAS